MEELSCSSEVDKMKFLADENVKSRLVKFLIEKGFDAEYGPKGENDSKLFSLSIKEKRVLLTHDKHFLNTSLFPPKLSSGVIVIRIHPPTLSRLESSLLRLLNTLSEKEIKGKLLVLREDSVEIEE